MCQQLGVSTIVYIPGRRKYSLGNRNFEAPLPGTRFDKNQTYLRSLLERGEFRRCRNEYESLRPPADRS